MRYLIELSYNGSNYHGWQRQDNALSIQEEIETALSIILREKIEVTGCGRTDAGVHAKYYTAHFDTISSVFTEKLVSSLNGFLNRYIAVQNIKPVNDSFHARFDAKSRTYEYFVETVKNPFNIDSSWHLYRKLNIDKIHKAAQYLYNFNDFTSFCKLHSDTKTNLCKILECEIISDGTLLIFRITADRFLRNMVRAIVGTLVDVGCEKITESDFCKIIESKDRCAAGQSAPAQGLFLVDVKY